jgi:hypothetical protein
VYGSIAVDLDLFDLEELVAPRSFVLHLLYPKSCIIVDHDIIR